MGAWSGRGIPPTRRKLHRLREQMERERVAELKEQAQEKGLGIREWRRIEKQAEMSGVSLESFWRRWVDEV